MDSKRKNQFLSVPTQPFSRKDFMPSPSDFIDQAHSNTQLPTNLIVDEVDANRHLATKRPGSSQWSNSARMTSHLRTEQLPAVSETALFQAHNVTGQTVANAKKGKPDPTVYYQSGDTFSHVTLGHKHGNNVGRSQAKTNKQYKIENVLGKDKTFQALETAPETAHGDPYYHKSRTEFVRVSSVQQQNELHALTANATQSKSKYNKR